MPPASRTKANESAEPVDVRLQEALDKLEALSRKQAELEAQLLKKSAEADQATAEVKALTADQEGWLVITSNPMYDGTTAGIKFNSGIAFLPANKTYPHLGGSSKGKTYTPGAEQVAKYLRDDFGYEIKFYSYEEMKQLKETMTDRQAARVAAEQSLQAEQEKMLRETTVRRT